MKKLIVLLLPLLLLSCVSKEGLSPESSKKPAGNPNSSILVEMFSDLQCPACKGAHESIVLPLLKEYGTAIRFEYRHMPLRAIHPYAEEAAEASECSADQGKFWEFIEDTYEDQSRLSRTDLIARAEKIGIADTDLFARCLASRIKRDAVQNDYEEGVKRGVQGTPTFFVLGEHAARNNLDLIKGMIEEKTEGQRL